MAAEAEAEAAEVVQEEKEPDADVQQKDVVVIVGPVQEGPADVGVAVAVS